MTIAFFCLYFFIMQKRRSVYPLDSWTILSAKRRFPSTMIKSDTNGWMASPPLHSLAPDSFLTRFVKANQLQHVSHFLFPPGALFSSPEQWWRGDDLPHTVCRRRHPHEGLDLFWMECKDGMYQSIQPSMQVPALLPGVLIHFHRDFLGETLYIQHPDICRDQAVFHTILGHMRPAVRTKSARITAGQSLGTISPAPDKSRVPAHLHVSCAWIKTGYSRQMLTWEELATNTAIQMIDPFSLLVQGSNSRDIQPEMNAETEIIPH